MNVELGVPSRPLKIISLGRLHWVKDYAFALRVMRLLKQRGVSFEFRILGDGPELEHLMFLSHDLGLEDLVEFSGSKTENEIARCFTKADVYLNTSYSEGMSNACIEAQAIGVPCIVPMISGMEDCIEHGKTGLIVNNRSEKSFVDAIISLINNYNLYDPNYILNRVNEKFNIDKQRVQWHQFFDRVISDAKVRL
jgi:colanic acid/amylovoran biosynthesis glycosyltransferase